MMTEARIKSIEQSDVIEPITGRKLQVTIQEVDFLDDDGEVIHTSITDVVFPKCTRFSTIEYSDSPVARAMINAEVEKSYNEMLSAFWKHG